jgi:hypothetical protein
VLTFWDRLSEAHDACLSWRGCLDWVNTPCIQPLENQRLAAELDFLIFQICWNGHKNANSIFDLLSNKELYSSEINDLLEPLKRTLVDSPDRRHFIAPTELLELIRYSHQNHRKFSYEKQYAQRFAEDGLVQRRWPAVASIAWILVGGCGHWISYIADPIASTIFHGDSLGLEMPAILHDALQWWLCDLWEKMGELMKLPSFSRF